MSIEQKSIDTLRFLSVDAINKANSGHPGLPMGAAPMAYTLWNNVMSHNPNNPDWINRDRFILSAGHGSALLYSLLHLYGYGITIDDLKEFRQLGSNTPGHPEFGDTVGVEATTGPLGQGVAIGVGMAMAEARMAARFNRDDIELIDHYTYLLAGDGDLMEGINYEAVSLAGTLGLGKLIMLYDSNSITIEGGTDLAFTENVGNRFEALGWHVLRVEDGNDIEDIEVKIKEAKKVKDKPTMIEVITEIGYGSPAVQGKNDAHGSPLGEENRKEMQEFLEWEEEETFFVPEDVQSHINNRVKELEEEEKRWNEKYKEYEKKYPKEFIDLSHWLELRVPEEFIDSDEFYKFDENYSTRVASGIVINRLASVMPNLIGGSADLAPSNMTYMNDRETFSKDNYNGSNIHYGIREHAMGAIVNGMSLHGGLRPFGATFLVFSDYMKPALRLSALMKQPAINVFTHDSIGVGEDGPTHQPVDQLPMLRSIPNSITFRPADSRETAAGWAVGIKNKNRPTSLVLSRQNLPLIDGTGIDAQKGGYILKKEENKLDTILIASGSEVSLAIDSAKKLEEEGIGTRVISMPSMELFEEQSEDYKEEVLPKNITKRVAIEAASPMGWYKYVGLEGKVIAMESFGASAPGDELFKKFGFTVENVVDTVNKL